MATITIYEIDNLANMTPIMSNNRYEALKLDIESKGQKQEILLRNNKIIDGRHRYKACIELGIEPIVKELGNISDEEVIDEIKSYTQGKASTPSQLAAEALKHYITLKNMGENVTLDGIAISYGVGDKTLKRLNYCYKQNSEYLDIFLDGDSVEIYSEKYGKKIVCNQVYTLEQTLKYNNSVKPSRVYREEESTIGYAYDVNIEFETEEGKDFFWKKYNDYTFSIAKDSPMCQDYIQYTNMKYPITNESLMPNSSIDQND